MTLDQFISHLCSLADHYNAGEFTVKIDAIGGIPSTVVGMIDMVDMDGDDFRLDFEEETLEIHAKQL